ncbi:6-phosphofructokinase [Proteiniclasticum sp. BAD-10]|uniref:Pyrophosphate--fructose 6-phosphate 1-phosphotransferase n=1 Tax=Proteiniclasticum sediminis TaxID=2804028 RepID=A0A941CR42_9CLOT|nr:6-phosphofructokinase [Proteiniclasticum sediminis]MBR0575781.1 6-phosphofructokinase [Proteiniclasticum sediminis]
MKNCVIAQSGGPTSVINASVMGLLRRNNETRVYDKVLGGINGIEGILQEDFVDLSLLTEEEIHAVTHTPSAALGSCRYKLKDAVTSKEEYERLFQIFEKHDIQAFFYAGGNDSQDTVRKLAAYAKDHGIAMNFIGIPKTVDNDLQVIDHAPGFGSAARYIAVSVLESFLDGLVYTNNGIFITETMGRDAGWLAASGALATYNGRRCADIVLLPEIPFEEEKFLKKVEEIYKTKNQVYIVASEGVRLPDGSFLAATKAHAHDSFGHAQLGGAGNALKGLIVDAGITSRVKVLELSTLQRSAFHLVSPVDLEEAGKLGAQALDLAAAGETGKVSILVRTADEPYTVEYTSTDAANIANHVKYMPRDMVTEDGMNITEEALRYFRPLTGELPVYRVLHHFHDEKK